MTEGEDRAAVKDLMSDITVDPRGVNAWIDEQVAKDQHLARLPYENGLTRFITVDRAAEIARGAALQIIADRDTLIANLRRAGYTVLEPLAGQDELG